MELRHLRYFVAVAEEQNVTRAAARLNVSQPPLSRQIRDLEDELGVALFNHTARSVRLTEAGHAFLKDAQAVLERADAAVQNAKAIASGRQGDLHVGYAPSLTVDLLPRALRLFEKENPGVRVHLQDLTSQEMLRGLRDGKLHAALLVQVSAKTMAGLTFEELQRCAVCVAIPPAHRLARARKIGLEDVLAEPIIAFTLADYPEFHLWVDDLFAAMKRAPLIKEEHDSVTSLIAAVEAGHGVALVLEPFRCFAPRVKVRALVPPPPPLALGVAYRKEGNSAPAEKLIGALKRAKSA
jgi:DNA-binding transcriptional LysR family regulator